MAREGTIEAELHCVVGNNRARRFYERLGWLCRDDIQEAVLGDQGETGVPFWRMTKTLVTG